jgi:hypothetical protein
MKWVTRERPKIDRIACPWLIAQFIDETPELLFAPTDQVAVAAGREGAVRSRNCRLRKVASRLTSH